QALLSHERAQESRSALDAASVGSRANQTTDRAEASLNHRFNRLSVQMRGSVADYTFGDIVNAGATSSNSDRNYTIYEETVRAAWEFKPTLSAFAEVAINQRVYDTAAATDLINRSSDGERYRTGLAFGNTGKILRGEVSLGYGVQRPDDSRLKDIDGLIVDANATWRATEATSLLFTARSDVSETTTDNVGGAFYRFLGVEARHAFRTYLIGSAGLSYATQNSHDGIIDEREIRATLGLEYFLNRETVLFSRYAHTDLDAVGVASDYSADEVHFGMKIRR
ncbi:MAG: outer membrane beta-barrel protein, partial [Hyphomicrobium sp.]